MDINPGSSIGKDVQVIREILFGEQMSLIMEKLDTLKAEITALQEKTTRLEQMLEKEQGERRTESAALAQNQAQALDERTQEHRSEFAAVRDEIQSLVAVQRNLHENMVNALAGALQNYMTRFSITPQPSEGQDE